VFSKNKCNPIPVIDPVHVSVGYKHPPDECIVTGHGGPVKYSREDNPTVLSLEAKLASLENAATALAFNSGMAAISSLILGEMMENTLLIVHWEVYGGTSLLIKELTANTNLRAIRVYPDTESIIEAIRPGSIVFLETMTNPTLKIVDVDQVIKAARDESAVVVVDNTFATPIIYKPLNRGADYSVESLTKYISGHNDVLGGSIAANRSLDHIWKWRTLLGGIIQPVEAYLVERGLKTLYLRFKKSSETALAVAEFLEDHPRVDEVFYPGLESSPYKSIADKIFEERLYGGVVSFKVKGLTTGNIREYLSKLRLIHPSPSLGGTESLLTYPVLSSSKYIPGDIRDRLGIKENLLRLSVGLEDEQEIIEDLSVMLSS
jgi:cystathionine gamma-synthase